MRFKFSSLDMKIPFGSEIVHQSTYNNYDSDRINSPNIIYSFKQSRKVPIMNRCGVFGGIFSSDFPNNMSK